MASESKKTVLVAMGANLVLAVTKLAGGLIGGSSALLAEAVHSLADTHERGVPADLAATGQPRT